MSRDDIILLSGRCDFPAFFEPAKFPNDDPDKRKYQCVFLVDKEADLSELREAMTAVAHDKFGKKLPKNMSWAVQDGDEDDAKPQYHGYWIIKPKTQRPPGVVGPRKERLSATSDIQIRGGDNIRISCNCYAYDVGGNKGVAIGLNNVQWVSKGEPFGEGGGASTDPMDDFEPIAVGPGEEPDVGDGTDDSDIPF